MLPLPAQPRDDKGIKILIVVDKEPKKEKVVESK